MTRKWYATLRHPKMYPHTKFGIPTSKNIGDMDRTRKRDGRTDSAITICLPKFLWGHKNGGHLKPGNISSWSLFQVQSYLPLSTLNYAGSQVSDHCPLGYLSSVLSSILKHIVDIHLNRIVPRMTTKGENEKYTKQNDS